MQDIFGTLNEWFVGSAQELGLRLLFTLLLVILFYSLRKIILELIFRKKDLDPQRLLRWRRYLNHTLFTLLLMILFPIWLPSIQNILPVIGIFGAGIAIALKEVILNSAGWFYIMVRRPFEEGNRIAINNHIGDVIDIRLQQFSMMEVKSREDGGQSTGRVIHIPNSFIFTAALSNSSKEFSFNWNEIIIPLTIGSNWQKAIEIIKEVAASSTDEITSADSRIRKSEKYYAIHYHKLTPGIYIEYKQKGIQITLRHLVEPRQVRQHTDHIWRELLLRFKREKDIILSQE